MDFLKISSLHYLFLFTAQKVLVPGDLIAQSVMRLTINTKHPVSGQKFFSVKSISCLLSMSQMSS